MSFGWFSRLRERVIATLSMFVGVTRIAIARFLSWRGWDPVAHFFYKLTLLDKPVYLSSLVQRTIVSNRLQMPWMELFRRGLVTAVIPALIIALFVLQAVYATQGKLYPSFGGTVTTTEVNSLKGFADFAARILLSMVGIIIPVLVLVIQNLGARTSPSFLPVFLRHMRPFQVFLVTLVSLVLTVFNYLGLQMGFLEHGYLLGLVTMSTMLVVPIACVLWLVRRVIDSMSDVRVYEFVAKEIVRQVDLDLRREVRFRVTRRLFQQECDRLNLFPTSLGPIGLLQALRTKDRGEIVDVNLRRLEFFTNELHNTIQIDHGAKAVIAKEPFQTVSPGDDVLGEVATEEKQHERLELDLSRAFVVITRSEELDEAQQLRDLLELLEEQTIRSIQSGLSAQFKTLMKAYTAILDAYMSRIKELGLQFTPKDLKEPFIEWWSLAMLEFTLRHVAERAAASQDRHFVEDFATWVGALAARSLEYQDYLVFKTSTELFPVLYHASHNSHNQLGIDRSVRMLGQLVDFTILRRIQRSQTAEEFQLGKTGLRYVIDALTAILRATITYKDVTGFRLVHPTLQEMLVYYNPPPALHRERGELEIRLRRGDQEDSQALASRLEFVQDILTLDVWVSRIVKTISFEAASYVLWEVKMDRLDPSIASEFAIPLASDLTDMDVLLNACEASMEYADSPARFMWDELPDTKKATAIDSDSRRLWFFVLRGLTLLRHGPQPARASEMLRSRRKKIETLLDEVKSNPQKWEWFLGP
jgi:hypothetical protein